MMQQFKILFLSSLFSTLIFQAVLAQDNNQMQLLSAIKTQNEKYMAAYAKADVEALASLHTNDVTILPPNRAAIEGQEGLKEWLRGDLSMGPSQIVLSTTKVERHGNIAYEIGKYSLDIKPEGQDVIFDEGNYMVIWQNQPNGEWLFHVDIFNSTLPLN